MADLATQGLMVAIANNEGTNNYNNPGNIKAPWATDSSGNPLPTVTMAGGQQITVFPTFDVGQAALEHQAGNVLNGSANYNPDMTIAEAAAVYTGNGPNAGSNWAKSLDPSGTLVTQDTTLAQYHALVDNGTLVPQTGLANPAANNGAPAAPTTSTSTSSSLSADDLPGRAATDYVPLPNQPSSNIQSFTPDLVITTGLDAIPWYNDPNLITGNPRIRSFVTPVSFQMIIKDKFGSPLSDSTGKPIQIQLNASVKSFSKSSKHVFSQMPSRTGIHVTLWGQQADLIEAQCSTGVFMNQFGLTDFLSTANASADVVKLLSSGFSHTVDEATGDVDVAVQTIQRNTSGQSAFRVAAQDAFVELLSLFKNNGNIWFRSDNSTGTVTGQQQAGVSSWSPTLGVSSQQGNARNNDVMARGAIAMQLKESTYLGYFKSLTWTQSADKPFSWDFSFVFQVERTITILSYPK